MTTKPNLIYKSLEVMLPFTHFPKKYLDTLSRDMYLKHFPARSRILCEDDDREDDQGLYVILEGRVEIWITTQPSDGYGGRCERLIHLLYENDFFGEYALTTGKPRNATAIAGICTHALILPKSCYRRYYEQDPQFTLALHEVLFTGMGQRQIRSNDLAALHHISPIRLRLIKFLTMMAHPASNQDNVPQELREYVVDHLSGSQIADMLCTERTTVSETLQLLEKEGIIWVERRRNNHIHIPSLDVLNTVFENEHSRKKVHLSRLHRQVGE